MARRERRRFSDECKDEVVALVRSSGKSIGEISRDVDLTETAGRGGCSAPTSTVARATV